MPYDANAARVARQSAKVRPSFTWGDPPKEYLLPPEVPIKMLSETESLDKAREANDGMALIAATKALLKMLLGKQYADFMKSDATLDDMLGIIEYYSEELGAPPGESSASES